MISRIDPDFRKCFKKLPKNIQNKAKEAYVAWKKDPYNPSLRFKQVSQTLPVWSVSIGIRWRALGLKDQNSISWFWIGSHEDYNNLVKRVRKKL